MELSSCTIVNNFIAPYTREEEEALGAGLCLLAKFIASAIRRQRECQITSKKGGEQ